MALPLIPLALRYGIKKFGPKALKALNIGANVSYGIDTAKQIKEGKTDNLEALSTVSALKVKAPILKFYDIIARDRKFGTSSKTKSYILKKKKVDDIKEQTNQYAVTATGRSATGVNKKYKTTETRSQIRDKKTPVAVFSKETGEIFGDPTKLGKEGVRKTKPKFSKKKESIGKSVVLNKEATKTKGDTAREIEEMRSTIAARLDDRKAKGDMKGTVVLSDKDGLVRRIYSQEAKKRGISLSFATVPKVTKGDLSGPTNPKLGKEFATAKLLTGDKKFASESEKLKTLGQQTAVLRYAKKGRIAKQDTAILGFHEQKIPKNISASTTYVKTGAGERTINTSPIYDPKTKKQAVKTVIDKESGGEYDVKQFNKKTIKTIETQAVKTDEKLITTPRNVIGATYRSLKNKGYTAKLIREKLNTKLSGRK
tara:strand:+ start:3197 stop:4474 length:1278 start_codon:yes stop_codon:yes gene_type:complete